MKRVGWVLVFFCLLVGCVGKKQRADDLVNRSREDSMRLPLACGNLSGLFASDTLDRMEAGGLFDDFVFSYASDSAFQLRHTVFPLSYNKNGVQTWISREDWKMDKLFLGEDCYTLLFDDENDMGMVEGKTLSEVKVDFYGLASRHLKQYWFKRLDGRWKLEKISTDTIVIDNPDEDFVMFYSRFATDSVFQLQHIATPLQFVTTDPDDEFSILETTLDVNQWYAFCPPLPRLWLSNIDYGQSNKKHSRTKILKLSGMGNGYSNILYFRKQGREWMLYKYEDTSV